MSHSRQIAGADVVLVNKTDLVSTEKVEDLERLIGQINPVATIHRTVQSTIDLKHIMGIDAYTSKAASLARQTLGRNSTESGDCHDDTCQDEHHSHLHHYELRGISSLQVSVPTLTQEAFDHLDEWIRTLLWENRLPEETSTSADKQVLRCKGIFQTDSGSTYVLQGVRSIYEISQADDINPDIGVPDSGKLIFIGKGLDAKVRSSLVNVVGRT